MSGTFGAYGKIPALGDFFRLDLPGSFTKAWDTWLQETLLQTRQALADRWDDTYLTAPIWRFTLAPGLAGPSGMMGVLMASVDRVGRQFPLTLAAPVEGSVAALHMANTPLFAHLEDVALSMLDEGASKERLAEALAPLHPLGPAAPPTLPYHGTAAPEHAFAAVSLSAEAGSAKAIWSSALADGHRLIAQGSLPNGALLFDLSQPEAMPS
ncbi:MAG: type VI secretion system-associated protein TagF [Pseudomonadota bacterium]